MKITEVRIFPKEGVEKKLRAFVTVTFDDCFVVRDIKVIEGSKGYFVAMPSRRIKEPCPKCGHRNVIRSNYCNQCGTSFPPVPLEAERETDPNLRQAEHKDIAHPVTAECRDYLQRTVLEAYQKERGKLEALQNQGQQSQ